MTAVSVIREEKVVIFEQNWQLTAPEMNTNN